MMCKVLVQNIAVEPLLTTGKLKSLLHDQEDGKKSRQEALTSLDHWWDDRRLEDSQS